MAWNTRAILIGCILSVMVYEVAQASKRHISGHASMQHRFCKMYRDIQQAFCSLYPTEIGFAMR
jgi:hypothetical protein